MTATATKTCAIVDGLNNVQTTTLSNGMQLVVNPMPDAPRLSMYAFLAGGNVVDKLPGASDLVDRLLMKGTATRSQEQIALELDSLSLELDFETRRDSNVIGAVMLPEDLDAALTLITDMTYHATLASYEREKQMMVGEIQMELDSPRARASDLLIRTVFNNSPYGITSTVFLEAMERLDSLEKLMAHYADCYRPERMTVSVAGPITLEQAAAKLEAAFPKRAAGNPLVVDAALEKSLLAHTIEENKTVNVVKEDSNQAHIYKAWVAPPMTSDDYYPLAVMNCLFGGAGLSSRLFLEMRDKQGLAYHVRSTYESYRYSGLLSLYIGTEPSNKQKCLDGFETECAKLMNEPVSGTELSETKQNLLGRRTVFLETASSWASYVGSSLAMGKTMDDLKTHEQKIMAVTPADIQAMAQKIFNQPSVISIVGPSSIF